MTTGTSNTFNPAWWLPGGHSQTLYRKFAASMPVQHRRQRLDLADGDFIDLDWSARIEMGNSDALVLIVHGLCGCSESSYVLALQTLLNRESIASVVMNLRGCSGEVNRKARTYHSGVSDDLAEVVASLKQSFPDKPLIVVGYSLGANVLLKYLGESGAQAQLAKAIAVSTPFTLARCSEALLSGLSRIYGRYFTRRLLADLNNKIAHFQALNMAAELACFSALGDISNIGSIWEFDDRVTAPLHGYRDARDYYQQCSSIGFLKAVAVPTLLIQSANDPMIPPAALPAMSDLSGSIEYELQHKGGHVGFVAARREPWLERRILRFIETD